MNASHTPIAAQRSQRSAAVLDLDTEMFGQIAQQIDNGNGFEVREVQKLPIR